MLILIYVKFIYILKYWKYYVKGIFMCIVRDLFMFLVLYVYFWRILVFRLLISLRCKYEYIL